MSSDLDKAIEIVAQYRKRSEAVESEPGPYGVQGSIQAGVVKRTLDNLLADLNSLKDQSND